jgi:hypothetical protein
MKDLQDCARILIIFAPDLAKFLTDITWISLER